MRVLMHAETSLTLGDFAEPDFTVESESPATHFSALPMFATSLGLCTFAVVAEYAKRFDGQVDDLEIDVDWDYVDEPFRVGHIDLTIRWPSVPHERIEAVERAAKKCTIHNTLHHPPEIATQILGANDD